MRFSTLITATALLAASTTLSTPILQTRDTTADQVVANINQMTTYSQGLQTVASSIDLGTLLSNLLSDLSDLLVPLQPILNIIQPMTTTALQITNALGTLSYTDEAAADICNSFNKFAAVGQGSLDTVTENEGLLQVLATLLTNLEGAIANLAAAVNIFAPSCNAAVPTLGR